MLQHPLKDLLAGQLTPLDQAGFAALINSHRGKVVLVDFWATWCDPCREELPKLVALSRKLPFELITVSADEPEQAGRVADEIPAPIVKLVFFIQQFHVHQNVTGIKLPGRSRLLGFQ